GSRLDEGVARACPRGRVHGTPQSRDGHVVGTRVAGCRLGASQDETNEGGEGGVGNLHALTMKLDEELPFMPFAGQRAKGRVAELSSLLAPGLGPGGAAIPFVV